MKSLIILLLVFCNQVFANYVDELKSFNLGIVPIRANKHIIKDVPSFSAETLSGKKFTNKDIKGPTILVFWSTNCSMCKKPLIDLSTIQEKIKASNLKISIHPVTTEGPNQIMTYFVKNKIKLGSLIDSTAKMHKAFGAMVTPLFFIIDKKGFVRGIIPGAIDVESDSFWNLVKYLAK